MVDKVWTGKFIPLCLVTWTKTPYDAANYVINVVGTPDLPYFVERKE